MEKRENHDAVFRDFLTFPLRWLGGNVYGSVFCEPFRSTVATVLSRF